jgi:hypothetical protein
MVLPLGGKNRGARTNDCATRAGCQLAAVAVILREVFRLLATSRCVERLFWANIFHHRDVVYMMGTRAGHRHGHCVILRSTAEGESNVNKPLHTVVMILLLLSGSLARAELRFTGVNLAGAEFGSHTLPGEFGRHYTYPDKATIDYFVDKGMNITSTWSTSRTACPPSTGSRRRTSRSQRSGPPARRT